MAFHDKFREFYSGDTAGIVSAQRGIRAGAPVAESFWHFYGLAVNLDRSRLVGVRHGRTETRSHCG